MLKLRYTAASLGLEHLGMVFLDPYEPNSHAIHYNIPERWPLRRRPDKHYCIFGIHLPHALHHVDVQGSLAQSSRSSNIYSRDDDAKLSICVGQERRDDVVHRELALRPDDGGATKGVRPVRAYKASLWIWCVCLPRLAGMPLVLALYSQVS
ncbi:hypothetical protein F5X99DRAFT_368442 [Biscogniauxia marginata]|nr:hypothetical protein F5X99DRAFT_368442 [Biscogniauxia marginata]